MGVAVPSLEGSLYLTDPQSIIAYQLRKYMRTPADTIPILADKIISLPAQVAKFGKEPNTLAANMQSDLQNVFSRVFSTERKITVSVTAVPVDDTTSTITISVIYTQLNGEVGQTGTTISLDPATGRLKIQEDTIRPNPSSL